METTQRTCPICERILIECEGAFACSEHGSWRAYGAHLLVRVPADVDKQPERVMMPWEVLTPATR